MIQVVFDFFYFFKVLFTCFKLFCLLSFYWHLLVFDLCEFGRVKTVLMSSSDAK